MFCTKIIQAYKKQNKIRNYKNKVFPTSFSNVTYWFQKTCLQRRRNLRMGKSPCCEVCCFKYYSYRLEFGKQLSFRNYNYLHVYYCGAYIFYTETCIFFFKKLVLVHTLEGKNGGMMIFFNANIDCSMTNLTRLQNWRVTYCFQILLEFSQSRIKNIELNLCTPNWICLRTRILFLIS